MTDDQREDRPERPSVFGNLPASRPGARSPRRESPGRGPSGGRRKETPSEPSAAAMQATPRPRTSAPGGDRPAGPETRRRPEPAGPEAERRAEPHARDVPTSADADADRGVGLEDLAWAGVAAVAETATIGVRLVSRAMEALRGSDRR